MPAPKENCNPNAFFAFEKYSSIDLSDAERKQLLATPAEGFKTREKKKEKHLREEKAKHFLLFKKCRGTEILISDHVLITTVDD